MSDLKRPQPDLECAICDDNDPCLPRWDDDGGGSDQSPSYLWSFEEAYVQNHGHDVRQFTGQRSDPFQGPDDGRQGTTSRGRSRLRAHDPRH
ncbi:hypothetical protein SAMN05444166_7869 [Singulisphaera sp. GP187]|nr:hypothetical protein SAMN05444166_7869 [Singulisphaera sp. GP187]